MKRNHFHCIALAAASLLWMPSSEATAQGMNIQLKGVVMGGGTASRHASTSPQQFSLFLEMHVEEMQAVSDLSDDQAKKLRLAGKSITQKLFSTENAPMRLQLGGRRPGAKPKEVDEDSLSDEDKEAPEEAQKPGRKIDIKKRVSLSQLTSHSLWKKATQSILTEEQRDKWATSQAEQTKRTRKLLVSHRTAVLQQQLSLRPEQVASVAEIVQRVEEDQLFVEFNMGRQDSWRMTRRSRSRKQVSESDLKDVLTPVQMKVWKSLRGSANSRPVNR